MAVFIEKAVFDKTLAQPPVQGKRLLEPLKSLAGTSGFPANVLEDANVENEPEVHVTEGDLWCCLEGEVMFVSGGELVEPREHKVPTEFKGTGIRGGTEYVLRAGDWLWIPPGEPHLHKTAGTARLVIIKIPQRST